MIEIITQLETCGTLKVLMQNGFVSPRILFYKEVYLEYDKQIKTTNRLPTHIVRDLSDSFRVSEDTIFRILRMFKKCK